MWNVRVWTHLLEGMRSSEERVACHVPEKTPDATYKSTHFHVAAVRLRPVCVVARRLRAFATGTRRSANLKEGDCALARHAC